MTDTIYNISKKSKIEDYNRPLIIGILVLALFSCFGAYKLWNIEHGKQPITVEYPKPELSITSSTQRVSTQLGTSTSGQKEASSSIKKEGNFVAARGGVRYYTKECSAGKKIADKNKIWFDTKEEAERFGYKPSLRCK